MHGVARQFTDIDKQDRAAVWLLRVLFPDAASGRYFNDADDIALTAIVPLNDPRLVFLQSDPRAEIAIRMACANAFWTNAYQWEMTKTGFLRLIQNIEGLNFGAASDPVQFEVERRHSFFTLENIIVRIVDGDNDQITLAGATRIDVLPDWSVQADGQVLR